MDIIFNEQTSRHVTNFIPQSETILLIELNTNLTGICPHS